MSLFKPYDLTKEPKKHLDMSAKKGIPLFFDILWRNCWELLKLNLAFILFSLPIVTAPAAYGAMVHVLLKMCQDEPVTAFRGFFEGFKKHWKMSSCYGFISAAIWGALIISLSFYSSLMQTQTIFVVFVALSFLFLLIFSMMNIYLLPMLLTVNLPFKLALRNSWLLSMSCLWKNLIAILSIVVIGGSCLIFYPITMPVILLFVFSVCTFISCFTGYFMIKKFVIDPYYEKSQS